MTVPPVWQSIVPPTVTVEQCYKETCRRYEKEQTQHLHAAAYIRNHWPEEVERLLHQADQFMNGKMVLCGTRGLPYFVGNPPKWSDNPVGDPEYTFMLNRMEHWPVLLYAYYLTKDSAYAEKVTAELENWIDTCPPPEVSLEDAAAKDCFSAMTPWRTLELGIRANRSWNLALQLLCGLPCFSLQLYQKMMISFYQQACVLYRLCPRLWPHADHNHYLTECLGLLEISCLCDFMVDAPVWRAHAIQELERCANVQILAGGGQIEGAPNYHNECQFQMTYSIFLAKRYGIHFSTQYEDNVRSMWNRSLYTARPDGCEVPWGDSDGRPLVFRAALFHYRAFNDIAPSILAVKYFGREQFFSELKNLIWCIPKVDKLLDALNRGLSVSEPSRLLHDQSLKQVMMRTGWSSDADSVFFSARSPIHNDHAHIDPNAFELYSHGYAVMPDPGRFTYREGGDRHYYKSTEAHNTVTVNGRDAFAYQGTWAYGPQKEGGILSAGEVDGALYACGFHNNYEPAVHYRVLILHPEMLAVFDAVDGLQPDDFVTARFLFDTTQATLKKEGFRALFPSQQLVCTQAFSGAQNTYIEVGRVSPEMDHERNARRFCMTAEGKSAQRLFSVICCRPAGQEIYAENLQVFESADTFRLIWSVRNKEYRYRINKTDWEVFPEK